MLKRTIWFTTGAAAGLGSSLWVQRRVKRAAERLLPQNVAQEVADRTRRLGSDARAAVREGREAMRERETELETTLANRSGDARSGPQIPRPAHRGGAGGPWARGAGDWERGPGPA